MVFYASQKQRKVTRGKEVCGNTNGYLYFTGAFIFIVIFSSESDDEETILVESKCVHFSLHCYICSDILCTTEAKKHCRNQMGMYLAKNQ